MASKLDTIIARATSGLLTDEDVAALAEDLAASGRQLPRHPLAADIASTGGPGSVSTLWCPAALVSLGHIVPKLGVPGRPSGGIDSLAQVPGYNIRLNPEEVPKTLVRCGYVHVLAGGAFAPADASMFARRQAVGAQAVAELAMASLLAKKLAMGVTSVGLEVRVAPHGNFGASRSEAEGNARRFCRIARMLGIAAVCFLTDGNIPQQPYLGRGEMLLAVSLLLDGTAPQWLARHASHCEVWAAELVGSEMASAVGVRDAFVANIEAQGGSCAGLQAVAAATLDRHTKVIVADSDGIVDYNLGALRSAILAARSLDSEKHFDDSAGVVLLVEPGRRVWRDDLLMSVRCTDNNWSSFSAALRNAINLSDSDDGLGAARLAGAMEIVRE